MAVSTGHKNARTQIALFGQLDVANAFHVMVVCHSIVSGEVAQSLEECSGAGVEPRCEMIVHEDDLRGIPQAGSQLLKYWSPEVSRQIGAHRQIDFDCDHVAGCQTC